MKEARRLSAPQLLRERPSAGWYAGVRGLSRTADFLFSMAGFWVFSGVLNLGSEWRIGVQVLLGMVTYLVPLRGAKSAQLGAILDVTGSMVRSIVMALLAITVFDSYSIAVVLVGMEIIAKAIPPLVGPVWQILYRDLLGEYQQEGELIFRSLDSIGRLVAGLLAFSFSGSVGSQTALGWLYTFDALTFLPMIIFLLLMVPKLSGYKNEVQRQSGTEEKREKLSTVRGLRYIFGDERLRFLLSIDTLSRCGITINFWVAVEIITTKYKGGLTEYGALLAITGLGGFVSTIVGSELLHRTRTELGRLFLLKTLVAFLVTALLGGSSTLQEYFIWYGVLSLFPWAVVVAAEYRRVPQSVYAHVNRAAEFWSEVVINALMASIVGGLRLAGFQMDGLLIAVGLFSFCAATVLIWFFFRNKANTLATLFPLNEG